MSIIFPCPYTLLLNTFSSGISWPISTKFHVDPTVEMELRVCSNSHASLTAMPIYGKIIIPKLFEEKAGDIVIPLSVPPSVGPSICNVVVLLLDHLS